MALTMLDKKAAQTDHTEWSPEIKAEFERTQAALNLITGDDKRLAANPSLARSIEHRFPYIDPLNHLQVELMRRYRRTQAARKA